MPIASTNDVTAGQRQNHSAGFSTPQGEDAGHLKAPEPPPQKRHWEAAAGLRREDEVAGPAGEAWATRSYLSTQTVGPSVGMLAKGLPQASRPPEPRETEMRACAEHCALIPVSAVKPRKHSGRSGG